LGGGLGEGCRDRADQEKRYCELHHRYKV
jgi:hypothetical protein